MFVSVTCERSEYRPYADHCADKVRSGPPKLRELPGPVGDRKSASTICGLPTRLSWEPGALRQRNEIRITYRVSQIRLKWYARRDAVDAAEGKVVQILPPTKRRTTEP